MSMCCNNRQGSGGADVPGVDSDPVDQERALLRATMGHQANNIESFSMYGDNGRVLGLNVGTMKTGRRGKNKCWWTHEERKVLWECFVRSEGKRTGGYIKKVKALWDERSLSEREVPSLLSQLKCIEKGLLTKMERGEIEKKVRDETRKIDVGRRQMVISREEWVVLLGENDDEEEFHGFQDFEVERDVNDPDRAAGGEELHGEVDFEIDDDDVNKEEIGEARGTSREIKVVVEKMVTFLGDDGLRMASDEEKDVFD